MGEKITIAFRVADGGLPASCITGGITDGAMAIPWRQNHPKKVEQRMAKAVVARMPEMA